MTVQPDAVDVPTVPTHIAIIMDGNGRWAQKRGLPRQKGHLAGAETFRKIAVHCRSLGIHYLTVYAFSTENWKRPGEEVQSIMSILADYLSEAMRDFRKEKVRFAFFGDRTKLSTPIRSMCEKLEQDSSVFSDCQVNICLNYGGRDEIVHAARAFARECAEGRKKPEELTEALFSDYLWSSGVPDPELVIRTGGEERISNFLPWQSIYSEFYFTDVLWPDFTEISLDEAIRVYQNRKRRFGGI